METIQKIKEFLKGDVLNDKKTLEKYSRDASIFHIMPEIVVFPKNTDDIKSLVKFVAKEKTDGKNISLTPRAAGTDMTGGPLSTSIVVEFVKYMHHLKTVGDDYAVVEPGIYYRDFEKETLQHDLILPCYPASREICTVGGMVGNNAGGEKTLAYGQTERYVKEVKMVLRDGEEYSFQALTMDELEAKKRETTLEGEVYREMYDLIDTNFDLLKNAKPKVTKNASGYYLWNVLDKEKKTFDLTKIITGSQGTLGIITEIKLALIQPKPHRRLLVIFLEEIEPLSHVVNHVLEFQPESFEFYDEQTFKMGIKFFPEIMRKMKGNIFRLAYNFLPEFLMLMTGGLPKLVLLAEFTGHTKEEADEKAQKAYEGLKEFRSLSAKVARTKIEAEKYWIIRRESFNLLRQKTRYLRTAPFIEDFVVLPEHLPHFLPKLYVILDSYKIVYTLAGHVGDGNFHIIPLVDMTLPASKEIIRKLADQVHDLVLSFKGSITAEHNDGLIRGPYLEKVFGTEVFRLFEKTKKIFDPENIFNPGKKVGASLDYAMEHLDTK